MTFYSYRRVSCRSISLLSFNGLCSNRKLPKIALFIYFMYYWVACMTSSVLSFTYFSHFSNFISPELMKIFPKGKLGF